AVFTFVVRNGAIDPHPRQLREHQPRTNYILPRFPGLLGTLGDDSAGHIYWMERTSRDSATASDATADGKPSEEDLRRWRWLPESIDPDRPFKLTVTDVSTRADTGLAAGEDLIVFGTGFPNGVAYIKCGDQEPRSIPSGESFSSRNFAVCGTKIVLVRRNQVHVFDSQSRELKTIPTTEISLYNPDAGPLSSSGFLVGTINRASDVADRTVLKILDVSGDEPRVIPIPNADYQDSEVSAVSIDADHGNVAVGVASRGVIYASRIAAGAKQHSIDLNSSGGVGTMPIFLEDDDVFYGDRTRRVRRLVLESGQSIALTEFPVPRSGDGFAVRKGRVVVASSQGKKGSRYPHWIAEWGETALAVPGTGEDVGNSGANLGMGGAAALAIDKTIFLAGTPGDSIGVGEILQVFQYDSPEWNPLRHADGELIPAAQVTTSMGLLAFKTTDADRRTVIGYATYGQRIESVDSALAEGASAGADSPAPAKKPSSPEPRAAMSAQDKAFLDAMLASELETAAPFLDAFGPKVGLEKAMNGFKQVFENAEKSHLFDDFKRRSKLPNSR
ncbi:MAG: hypothetical protein AAF989_14805, partial [Planctomycetota bacterium]